MFKVNNIVLNTPTSLQILKKGVGDYFLMSQIK